MPTTKTSKPAAKKAAPAKTAATKTARPKARMALAEAMSALKKAGSEQTRKTYTRHGATEPMFGVSFATLKDMTKKIDVDHELALALWETGNFDARNLAVKVVDPARITAAELDRWAAEASFVMMCGSYVGMLAGEGPHAGKKLDPWLSSSDAGKRMSGWALFNHLAQRDESLPDEFFEKRLAAIERGIHGAPNKERYMMNSAVIAIGCRNKALRKAALAAAKRIGKVEVDHGDTSCKTPDAAASIEKAWEYASSKKFDSPAAQERARDVPRRRC